MNKNIATILKGGISATAVMTLLMVAAPMMGMPEMAIGKMLAGFMHIPVAAGWIMHFIIGSMIATVYVFVWRNRLSGSPALRGLLFSLIPFFIAQTVIMPIMGKGIFSMNTPLPLMMVMGSLIGHLVYGAVLGAVTK